MKKILDTYIFSKNKIFEKFNFVIINIIILMNYNKIKLVKNFSFLKKYIYLKSSSFYDKNQENCYPIFIIINKKQLLYAL